MKSGNLTSGTPPYYNDNEEIPKEEVFFYDFTNEEIERLQNFVKKYNKYYPNPTSEIFELLDNFSATVSGYRYNHDSIIESLGNPLFDINGKIDNCSN